MPHDQVVTPRHLLEAQFLLERSNHVRLLQDLEYREPELANYFMESLSQVYAQLTALGGPARRTHQVFQRIEGCLLVCLQAQRAAHRELWDSDAFAPSAPFGPQPSPPPI